MRQEHSFTGVQRGFEPRIERMTTPYNSEAEFRQHLDDCSGDYDYDRIVATIEMLGLEARSRDRHFDRAEKVEKERDVARNLLRACANVARGLEAPSDEVLSVLEPLLTKVAKLREALTVAHLFAFDVQEFASDAHIFRWDDGDEPVQARASEVERVTRAALGETE